MEIELPYSVSCHANSILNVLDLSTKSNANFSGWYVRNQHWMTSIYTLKALSCTSWAVSPTRPHSVTNLQPCVSLPRSMARARSPNDSSPYRYDMYASDKSILPIVDRADLDVLCQLWRSKISHSKTSATTKAIRVGSTQTWSILPCDQQLPRSHVGSPKSDDVDRQ